MRIRWHELDARHVLKVPAIGLVDGPSAFDPALEATELADPDGGEEVAHPVVEAEARVLVVGDRFPGLCGQVTRLLGQLGRVGDQHARRHPS